MDVQIETFTERLAVVVVEATEIGVDVVPSLKQLEGRHEVFLERPRRVLQTRREETVELITEDSKELITHHFEAVHDGGRNPEVPRAMSKVKDKNQLAKPALEGFGVLTEPITARTETWCFHSIPSEGIVEVATEIESNVGRKTRSVKTRRKFVMRSQVVCTWTRKMTTRLRAT